MRFVVANNKIRIIVKDDNTRDIINQYFNNSAAFYLAATLAYTGIGWAFFKVVGIL